MKSVNTVTLLGNVSRDPELKSTPTGQTVCTFGLATNRVWKDANGEKQTLPEFHNVIAWAGLADLCGKYVKKGKPLYVKGYLKTHTWEDNQNKMKHYMTEVVMQDLVLLGSKSAASDAAEEVEDEEKEEEAVAV
ncbi:single-stranded DNA-binding protein [Candidatus Peribacteria bacterium]|nr:single-stranded DNA-binding protein [Candidatus Peribacteria bacterium]